MRRRATVIASALFSLLFKGASSTMSLARHLSASLNGTLQLLSALRGVISQVAGSTFMIQILWDIHVDSKCVRKKHM